MAQELVRLGAEVDLLGSDGMTPLHYASRFNLLPTCLQLVPNFFTSALLCPKFHELSSVVWVLPYHCKWWHGTSTFWKLHMRPFSVYTLKFLYRKEKANFRARQIATESNANHATKYNLCNLSEHIPIPCQLLLFVIIAAGIFTISPMTLMVSARKLMSKAQIREKHNRAGDVRQNRLWGKRRGPRLGYGSGACGGEESMRYQGEWCQKYLWNQKWCWYLWNICETFVKSKMVLMPKLGRHLFAAAASPRCNARPLEGDLSNHYFFVAVTKLCFCFQR